MKVGIRVYCAVCHKIKKPHGRSAPLGGFYCDEMCQGYYQDPQPGCLWPQETEKDFGYVICNHGVRDEKED